MSLWSQNRFVTIIKALSSHQRRRTLLAASLICAFFFGLTLQRYQFFPYSQIKYVFNQAGLLVRKIATLGKAPFVEPRIVLSRQYTRDTLKDSPDLAIDTVLLPLNATGLRVSAHVSFPKASGAIAIVDEAIVVLDRLGNVYGCKLPCGSVVRLPFPPLPNNIADYLKSAGALWDRPMSQATFKAYDIEYIAASKTLAVSHEHFDKQHGKTRVALSLIEIDERKLAPVGAWQTIFLADLNPNVPVEAGGGRIASDGLNRIFLTLGDHNMWFAAQDPKVKFGKIVEIDLATRKDKIVSMGHRNPQGLTLTQSGDLLSTEHGALGGDKLNWVEEGANFGHADIALGTNYNSYEMPEGSGRYTSPLFAWLPAIGVSNLIEIKNFHRRWDGDILVGSLRALSLFRLRLENKRVVYSESIWIGQRIRDIAQLPSGTIVLWTDSAELIFLSLDKMRLSQDNRLLLAADDPLANGRFPCLHCHHLGATNPSHTAPSLTNVYGRKIGGDNWRYSSALRNKDGVWDDKSLTEFLSHPDKFARGTSMSRQDLSPVDVELLVKRLKTLRN